MIKAITLLKLICFVIGHDLPRDHASIFRHRSVNVYNKVDLSTPTCYGYEHDCNHTTRFEPNWPHSCSGHENWQFWSQGDFGYIRKKLDEMIPICHSGHSSLNCTERLQFCQAKNLFMDLRNARSRNWPPHKQDVFDPNEIGGNCVVDGHAISRQDTPNLNGDLRSWFAELKTFTNVHAYFDNDSRCDVIINKPVVFVKLDQGENLYHHMCDFFNLYLSLHINGSVDFNTDIIIVHWHWLERKYFDLFDESWKIFTRHPVVDIKDWFGKKVCFATALFSSLPRMILGLFYNTPLGDTCRGSGMMKSFSQFFLHRIGINQNQRPAGVIRVTFLTRKSYDQNVTGTMYRRIVNAQVLVDVIKSVPGFQVQVVEFKHDEISFRNQLELISNTDIFISVHGAGLTHLIFLPDWAVVFELYNCEAKCFRDLARLRGIRHMTWHDPTKMTKHKVTDEEIHEHNYRYYNFSFDPDEFHRLLLQARNLIISPNPEHSEL